MNIALPALVCFLVVLPGFIARSRFRHVENRTLDYSPFGEVVSEGIVVSAVLHIFCIWSTYQITGWFFEPTYFLNLFAADPRIQALGLARVAEQYPRVIAYFAYVYSVAYLGPALIRLVVARLKLDRGDSRFTHWFRFSGAPWYYVFSGADLPKEGKDADFIYISAVVNLAGNPYLYRGILQKYFLNRDGSLDRMVLFNVARRQLSNDKPSTVASDSDASDVMHSDRFYAIDGNYFVLRYSEAITLNIEFFTIEEPDSIDPLPSSVDGSLGMLAVPDA